MKREESRAQTRERLRSSAREIFAREGIAAASIDRIAEHAGYSRGAFYSNYPDKHTLALELLEESQGDEIALWTAKMGQIDDPEQRIEVLCRSFNKFHSDGDRSLLSIELQMEAERRPAFGARFAEYLATLEHSIATLLLVLYERAARTPPVDVNVLARTMRALTLGLALQARPALQTGAATDPGAMLGLFLRAILELETVKIVNWENANATVS